jgi:hypothetical protein
MVWEPDRSASIIGSIEANLWADKLSITTTAPVHKLGTKNGELPTLFFD